MVTSVSNRTLQRNRSVMLAITSLMSLGYIFGITAAHFQAPGLIITFMVVHLVLALVIFAFRCISDEQVSRFLTFILVPAFEILSCFNLNFPFRSA